MRCSDSSNMGDAKGIRLCSVETKAVGRGLREKHESSERIMKARAAHTIQHPRPSRSGCKRGHSWAGSLGR